MENENEKVYLCYFPDYWDAREGIGAASSFEARKAFAAKHAAQISDVCAVRAVKRDGIWVRAETI